MRQPTLFERFCEWLAWKLPYELIYWCVVRGFADASVEKYTNKTPDEITVYQVMWFLADKRTPAKGDSNAHVQPKESEG